MWDALPVSFIGRSTGQGSPALIMSRELYYGCGLQGVRKYGHWLGEYPAEKGKPNTVCME